MESGLSPITSLLILLSSLLALLMMLQPRVEGRNRCSIYDCTEEETIGDGESQWAEVDVSGGEGLVVRELMC